MSACGSRIVPSFHCHCSWDTPNSSLHVSASKVLQETCNYIRNLHREVDDLSERLSQLLASTENDSAEAAIIRSLFM